MSGAAGQEEEGVGDVEDGVGVGDLARDLGGEPGGVRELRGLRGNRAPRAAVRWGMKADPEEDADDIEDDVDEGDPEGLPALAEGGEEGGDAGADVGAEDQGDAGREGEQPLAGEGDDDAGGGRGRLDEGGEHGADRGCRGRGSPCRP